MEGNWYSIDVCTNCEKRLNDSQKMYNNGTCPHCGFSVKGTVCNTWKVTLKKIKHYKWWQIRNRKRTYIGADDYSKNWLNKN